MDGKIDHLKKGPTNKVKVNKAQPLDRIGQMMAQKTRIIICFSNQITHLRYGLQAAQKYNNKISPYFWQSANLERFGLAIKIASQKCINN